MKQRIIDRQFFLKLSTLLAASSLGFAFIAQYIQGVVPCNLCTYERYVYTALLCVGLLSLKYPRKIYFSVVLLIIAIGILLGGYHLGVEWHLWQAPESCRGLSAPHGSFEDFQAAFMKKPVVRCDLPGWMILNISATVWNFLFWLSLGIYGAICSIDRKI